MKRPIPYIVRGAAIAFATVAIVALLLLSAPRGSTYSIAQVIAGLSHHPHLWLGRTVAVRATALWVAHFPDGTYAVQLLDHWPLQGHPAATMWVSGTATNLLFDYVKWMPTIGRLIPGWRYNGHTTIYRVRLTTAILKSCSAGRPCVIGQLQ